MVVSGTTTIRVRPPATAEDVEVADLLFGDEQGTLMYLVGSDFDGAPARQRGTDEDLVGAPGPSARGRGQAYPGRQRGPGVQAIEADDTVTVRKPDVDAAVGLLAPVMDVGAVRKTAGKKKEELDKTTAVAKQLRTEIAPEAGDAIQGYIVARRREIAAEVGTALN